MLLTTFNAKTRRTMKDREGALSAFLSPYSTGSAASVASTVGRRNSNLGKLEMYSISLSRALPSSASRLPGTATRAVGYRVSHAIPTKTHACRPLHVSSRTDASDQQETSSNSNSADTSPQRRFVPPPTPGGKIQPGGSQRGPRVGTLVLGLIAIGVGATVLGLVDFFGSLKTWPKEVRDDLRTAIKARNRGESRRAEAHFRR